MQGSPQRGVPDGDAPRLLSELVEVHGPLQLSGHVEQALEVISRGVELLPPVEISPRLPSPVFNTEGT